MTTTVLHSHSLPNPERRQIAEQFLAELFSIIPPGASYKPLIASKATVEGSGWRVGVYGNFLDRPYLGEEDQNCYSVVMAGVRAYDERTQQYTYGRSKSHFGAGLCFMVDDLGDVDTDGNLIGVGAKLPLHKIITGPATAPTALIETSPGNFQALYFFESPCEDILVFEELISAFVLKFYKNEHRSDPGMKGVNRVFRIPFGINTKDKYKNAEGQPFQVRLAVSNYARRFTPEELYEAFGLHEARAAIQAERKERIERLRIEVGEEELAFRVQEFEDIFEQMEKAGLLNSSRYRQHTENRQYVVTCPWVDHHTGGVDSGSYLFSPSEDNGWNGHYECHHGHCESSKLGQVKDWFRARRLSHISVQRLLDNLPSLAMRDEQARIEKQRAAMEWATHLEYAPPAKMELPPAPRPAIHTLSSVWPTWDELCANASAPQWIIQSFLERRTVGFVYGPSQVGKSYWVMDLCAHVAADDKYLDEDCFQTNVLYCAIESYGTMHQRLKALEVAKPDLARRAKNHIFFNDQLPYGMLGIPQAVDYEAQQRNNKLAENARNYIIQNGIGLIVIDTFSVALPPDCDENDNLQMSQVISAMQRYAEDVNCCIIIVHHTGKSKEAVGPRGASALFNNSHFMVALQLVDAEYKVSKVLFEKNKSSGKSGHLCDIRLATVRIGDESLKGGGTRPLTNACVETRKPEGFTVNTAGLDKTLNAMYTEHKRDQDKMDVVESIRILMARHPGEYSFKQSDIWRSVNGIREDMGRELLKASANISRHIESLMRDQIVYNDNGRFGLTEGEKQ